MTKKTKKMTTLTVKLLPPKKTVRVKAWAVVDNAGKIPTGIYKERGIFRTYESFQDAAYGEDEDSVVPCTITYTI